MKNILVCMGMDLVGDGKAGGGWIKTEDLCWTLIPWISQYMYFVWIILADADVGLDAGLDSEEVVGQGVGQDYHQGDIHISDSGLKFLEISNEGK